MKTMKGRAITVLGDVKKVGDKAPEFEVVNNNMELISSNTFDAKYLVLNVVPSLDTAVCDLQTKTINEELAANEDVLVVTISNDLPFAQNRWCGNAGLDNVLAVSDYLKLDFAKKYGVLIEDNRLLARSVFVLDKNRDVIYVEYLDEMGNHPNYDQLLSFVKQLPKD